MNKEVMIARIIGEYDGKKRMLIMASEELFRNAPSNEAGEVDSEYILRMNEWIDRMQNKIERSLVNELVRIDKM